MSAQRRHRIVLDVSFDRPIKYKRAAYLLEEAIRNIHKLGRDHSRPGEPEVKLIRATIKRLAFVIAAENRRVKHTSPTEEQLRSVIRDELANTKWHPLFKVGEQS